MSIAKPTLEQIRPSFGSSLFVKQFSRENPNKAPFWHYHPELELVYVKGGQGKRHIGNNISYYQNGDLTLIGANLPHYGFTDRLTGNKSETIIQMREDFLGPDFFDHTELRPIKRLFETAKQGIMFKGDTKNVIGARIEKLVILDPLERLIEYLSILAALAKTEEYEVINAEAVSIEASPEDQHRINLIYNYVRANYTKDIPLAEIANLASMTVPGFCRYFKKISNKTFTRFVNEYRIVHATKLLAEGNLNITDICYESGFNNFSHFNKQFREITGKSPSAYRKTLRSVVK